jgi:hypothetical protein
MKNDNKTVPHVCIGEGIWIPVSSTEFIDISEDIFGVDTMTFRYEGNIYTSTITLRPA